MSGQLLPGDLEYLTEDDEETLGDIFACATAMIGAGIYKGNKEEGSSAYGAVPKSRRRGAGLC
jgi:hypothetical protein